MSEFTTTPNYGLIKPNDNADVDLWGVHLNANADTIDTQMKTNANAASGAIPLTQKAAANGVASPRQDGGVRARQRTIRHGVRHVAGGDFQPARRSRHARRRN